MSQGDAVSNPFDLTVVCLMIRTDSVDADGVTCRVDELEESPPLAVTVDLVVRPASPGEVARAARSGHGDLAVKLRESLSGYLADRVVSAWQIGPDAGSLAQAADEVNAAADGIRVLVQVPLERAATAAGVPQCPAGVEAGVIAAFVTEPITRPIAEVGTLIEIAGVIIGIVANIHPLALACANRLAKKKITDLVAKRIAEVMNSLAGVTTATDASAEEAAARQLDPQDPADAQHQRQLDELRKTGYIREADYIGPEVQDPPQVQSAGSILRGIDDPGEAATDDDAATNATWGFSAT